MPDAEIKLAPPYQFDVSEDVRGYYGYKDGHVELEVKLPFPLSTVKKVYREVFTLTDFLKFMEGAEKAVMWGKLPDYQRERDGAK